MFIHKFQDVRFFSNSAQVKLPRLHLVLDPIVSHPRGFGKFNCLYHEDGITVTVTTRSPGAWRTNRDVFSFSMRVYDPTIEDVPNFDSTIYKYSGLDDERAPLNTTVAIINPSVKTIKRDAFRFCSKMKKCIMYDGVETIEKEAFLHCVSLDALFLPSSLQNIAEGAFWYCRNIRILSLPIDIDISQFGRGIMVHCRTFFQITQIPQYRFRNRRSINNNQVHQAVIDLYRNLPPLHRACLDFNVNVQSIHDCINTHGSATTSTTDHGGMTPLHILTMNPHATDGSIKECFDADMSAAFVGDDSGNTPLDYLKDHNLAGHTWIVTSLCIHREAYSSTGVSHNAGNKALRENKRKRVA